MAPPDVRDHGYAVSHGEFVPDLISVGAPIRGADRREVIAGLGLVVPATRCSSALEQRMASRLLDASVDISGRLAGT